MTLMLAGRHPDLWSAAVDMFGPYDLVTFSERIPPTWKPYYKLAIGDADDPEDRKHLEEMSPKTYLNQLACPMLVIQGANDPRVVAQESRDLVADLSADGKDIDLLVFDPGVAFLAGELNANRDQDVRRALAPLRAMLEDTGCAAVLIRHLNKDSKSSNAIYRGGGSIGFQ